jgi:1-acyl-sn-glycerol-3-phosphate acyltransferase
MPLPPLPDPPDARARARALARTAPVVTGLGLALFGFNAAQMASLAVRPVSGKAFRAFNRWAADTWWGWTVDAARWLHGVELVVTGDDVPPRENAIVVANHQQMPDITFLMRLAQQKERLGDLKWFVKRALKVVPGVGWGLSFLDALFVDRDWAKDRASIERTFAHITRNSVPLWLILFPEGTRITPEKLERARAWARERGRPAPSHVLAPRTKGFAAAVQGLRGHATAVYDVTIGYERGVPTLWQYMRGFAPRAHSDVRRHPLDALPARDDELAAWLLDRWQEKDARLAAFYETGAFPTR